MTPEEMDQRYVFVDGLILGLEMTLEMHKVSHPYFSPFPDKVMAMLQVYRLERAELRADLEDREG